MCIHPVGSFGAVPAISERVHQHDAHGVPVASHVGSTGRVDSRG
jgi:hypothetical protein